VIFLLTFNFVFQITQLFGEMNEEKEIMVSVYWICTVLTVIFSIMARYNSIYTYHAFSIIYARNVLRTIDVENTKENVDPFWFWCLMIS
jgi:hypothetical protein